MNALNVKVVLNLEKEIVACFAPMEM
ncbi:uncharacterized protein METZ01_LOCUS150469 [marine metagenome]|uniref:Uncharacterized protein n=1 Tax=marine metagenome TaxID=408172 RepID=A0A382A7U3_9ZZZZ